MRDLAILTFVTLDGVMQAPGIPDEDRSGGFQEGGWAAPYWADVMKQVEAEAMSAPYDMLFGRKTYDLFANHWPQSSEKDPVAQMMNAAKKYVVTSNPAGLTWNNSEALTGNIPKKITQLKSENGPLLQVHGSSELIQLLMAHNLIDEFRLWTFPVMVGAGKQLFRQKAPPLNLNLVKSATAPAGVVMNLYRRQ